MIFASFLFRVIKPNETVSFRPIAVISVTQNKRGATIRFFSLPPPCRKIFVPNAPIYPIGLLFRDPRPRFFLLMFINRHLTYYIFVLQINKVCSELW